MERVQRLLADVKSLRPDFVATPYVDVVAIGDFVSEEPSDTRKLSEIIEERISECKYLSEQLRKK
jgi:hypothetical protein